MEPTIILSDGTFYDLTGRTKNAKIPIEVIAHSLSNLCRFTGHTEEFYSVAQHSVLVSEAVPKEFALQGLMHDVAEVVTGDISTPFKLLLADLEEIEERIEAEMYTSYGLPAKLDPVVKQADIAVFATEDRDLIPTHTPWPVLDNVVPLFDTIIPWTPAQARTEFLKRFEELT